jgi:hypothetical protein
MKNTVMKTKTTNKKGLPKVPHWVVDTVETERPEGGFGLYLTVPPYTSQVQGQNYQLLQTIQLSRG